jgi:hypothetical protein
MYGLGDLTFKFLTKVLRFFAFGAVNKPKNEQFALSRPREWNLENVGRIPGILGHSVLRPKASRSLCVEKKRDSGILVAVGLNCNSSNGNTTELLRIASL